MFMICEKHLSTIDHGHPLKLTTHVIKGSQSFSLPNCFCIHSFSISTKVRPSIKKD